MSVLISGFSRKSIPTRSGKPIRRWRGWVQRQPGTRTRDKLSPHWFWMQQKRSHRCCNWCCSRNNKWLVGCWIFTCVVFIVTSIYVTSILNQREPWALLMGNVKHWHRSQERNDRYYSLAESLILPSRSVISIRTNFLWLCESLLTSKLVVLSFPCK